MQRKIDVLRERYSSASWAIWSAEYPDDGCAEEHPSDFYDFVHSNLDHLRPEIVLLSLNPSTDKPGKFLNFHSTNSKHNDNRLRRFVEQSGLDGAYMTDFVMDTIESDSKQVNHDRLDVLVFLNQLNLLDRDEYHVLCFLEEPFQALMTYFGESDTDLKHNVRTFSVDWNGSTIHFYRIWFYGNWGAHADKIPELEKQLNYLGQRINGL